MNKIISIEEAVKKVNKGDKIGTSCFWQNKSTVKEVRT